jgi:hypothetical protein
MYTNQRRALARVLDYIVMRDTMTETRDLCIFILRAGASRLCLSHVVNLDENSGQVRGSLVQFTLFMRMLNPHVSPSVIEFLSYNV